MIEIMFSDRDRGEDRTFADPAQALVWAQDEQSKWSQSTRSLAKEPSEALEAILGAWKDVTGKLNRYRLQNHTKIDDFNLSITPKNLILSESIIGNSLLTVLHYLGIKYFDYAAFSNKIGDGDVRWTDDAAFKGIMLFEKIKNDMRNDEDIDNNNSKSRFADALSERINHLTDSVGNLDKLVTSSQIDIQQIIDQNKTVDATRETNSMKRWDSFARKAEKLEEESNNSVKTSISNLEIATRGAQDKINSWISAREEERQLKAPAKLWSDRSETHENNARKWRNWSLGAGLLGLMLSFAIATQSMKYARFLFENATISNEISTFKAGTTLLRPTFHFELIFAAAVTISWLTMYLWAMRVLVRLYTTEHHLSIDASARGAMMETYLGLVEAGAANAADRPIVLSALFRPVQDGMVKEEGPPTLTPAALISALTTPGNKS